MLINEYTDKQRFSFLQAIKYYEHCDGKDYMERKGELLQIVKLSMFDTLIMTDGVLEESREVSINENDDEYSGYDEVHMSELTFKNATYVLQMLIANRCTNSSNDKPFEYNSHNICNLYMKNIKDKEVLKEIKEEINKLSNKKLSSKLNYDFENTPSINNGIYRKVLKRK